MSRYRTKIHWGNFEKPWPADADLEIQVIHKSVLPAMSAPETETAALPCKRHSDVTFYDDGKTFQSKSPLPSE